MALVVGLTGGIGSGKSEALAAFARHGAATMSSDQVVRELYLRQGDRLSVQPEEHLALSLHSRSCPSAFAGSLDRPTMASLPL